MKTNLQGKAWPLVMLVAVIFLGGLVPKEADMENRLLTPALSSNEEEREKMRRLDDEAWREREESRQQQARQDRLIMEADLESERQFEKKLDEYEALLRRDGASLEPIREIEEKHRRKQSEQAEQRREKF